MFKLIWSIWLLVASIAPVLSANPTVLLNIVYDGQNRANTGYDEALKHPLNYDETAMFIAGEKQAGLSAECSAFGLFAEFLAAKTEATFVNLASPQRTTHILTGDATGGGHLFPGGAGKSPFPQSWSADRVMHEISDVATDPLSVFTPGRGGRTIVTGTRDGVDIRVILGNQKEGGGIITGFPSNIPRNP